MSTQRPCTKSRTLVAICAVMTLIVVAQFCAGVYSARAAVQKDAVREVRATSFVLVGAKGRELATLGSLDNGETAQLVFLNRVEEPRLTIGQVGQGRYSIGFVGANDRDSLIITCNDEGDALISFWDQKKGHGMGIQWLAEGESLTLFDTNGKKIFSTPATVE